LDPECLPYEIFVVGDRSAPEFANLRTIVIERGRFPGAEHLALLRVFRQQRFDSVMYLKTTIPLTHLAFDFDKTIVVHDLVYYDDAIHEYPLSETARFKCLFPISLFFSTRCVAVSNATVLDLKSRFGWFKRPVSVCHASVPAELRAPKDEAALSEMGVHRPYLFYCGSLSPRKNLIRVLEAFRSLDPSIAPRFYISSNASWRDTRILSFIRDHLEGRAFLLGRIRDDQMSAMYSHADALVYVSLYEGFGMPILEAQALGCPVITSNSTSCPEVAGDGALLVDAENVAAIAEGMRQVLSCARLRARLRTKGFRNLERFSWRRTAQILLTQND